MKTLEKREWIGVAVAVLAATILFFGHTIWGYITGSNRAEMSPASQEILSTAGTTTAMELSATNISAVKGVEIYDLRVGTGTEAVAGKKVTAHYVGTFPNGTKFDSSLDRGTPYTFTLGSGTVIKGWDIGITGMRPGGVRALVISPEYGYGKAMIGEIPANSTLVFQVQLIDVQ
ncbi:MAG TPA: FKBP-type peptidyl-prolyl cis-trans isomerase [Candidatus Paceibacterota bacterium]